MCQQQQHVRCTAVETTTHRLYCCRISFAHSASRRTVHCSSNNLYSSTVIHSKYGFHRCTKPFPQKQTKKLCVLSPVWPTPANAPAYPHRNALTGSRIDGTQHHTRTHETTNTKPAWKAKLILAATTGTRIAMQLKCTMSGIGSSAVVDVLFTPCIT